MRYRFGEFELDTRTEELRKDGRLLRLPGRAFRALAFLLENAGEIVTREELKKRIWPAEVHVEFEHGLNNAIHDIRGALGSSRDALETLPRRGYRFLGEVERISDESAIRAYPSSAAALLLLPVLALVLWGLTRLGRILRRRKPSFAATTSLRRRLPKPCGKASRASGKLSRSRRSSPPRMPVEPAPTTSSRLSAPFRGTKRGGKRESPPRGLSSSIRAAVRRSRFSRESRFRFSDRRDGVESLFRRALELDPESAETHQWYGNFLAIEGRIEEGLREMELARSLDPLSLHINSDLGALLYEAGFREKAMAQFERTFELDPDYPKTHFLLGHVYLSEGRVEEAVASFEKSVALSPGTPKYRDAYVKALARSETNPPPPGSPRAQSRR